MKAKRSALKVSDKRGVIIPSALRQRVRISELADVDPESFKPDSPVDFHYIDLSSIDEPGARPTTIVINSNNRPSRAQRRTKNGDLLVSNVRPYLRNFSRVEEFSSTDIVVASTGFTVVRPRDERLGGLIYQALLSESFHDGSGLE